MYFLLKKKTQLKCYVSMLERKKINASLADYYEIITACIDLFDALGFSAKLIKLFLISALFYYYVMYFFSGESF